MALWVVQLLLAVQFAGGGAAKLAGDPVMVAMFDTIVGGDGDGLRYLVGGLEVAGAVGLLVPPLTGLAALGLVALLVGATITNLAVLHVSPVLALGLLVLAAVVAYGRRRSVARLFRRGRRA